MVNRLTRISDRIVELLVVLFEKLSGWFLQKKKNFSLETTIERLVYFLKRFRYYLVVWLKMSKNSFMKYLLQKKLFFLFLLGKVLRFAFFTTFLFYLVKGADNLAGYDSNQAIFFFLTFNVVDVVTQFFFREVYRFRPLIISGDFDLVLAKPLNSLVRILFGGADVIDLVTIPPIIFAVVYFGRLLNPQVIDVLFYVLLLINAFLIATAFHIAVLAFGIITLEVDHTVWMYRDFTSLGRFPVDIYRQPLKGILTYIIPVGVMMSLPAKAMMGLVSIRGVLISMGLVVLMMFVSFRFWGYALKQYTSASS